MKKRVKQLLAFRRLLLFFSYTVGLIAGLWLSYQLRFDFDIPPDYYVQLGFALCWVIPLKLLLLLAFGQYSGKLTVFSTPDFGRVLSAMGVSALLIFCLRWVDELEIVPPRSIVALDFVLSFVVLGGLRLSLRMIWERLRTLSAKDIETTRRVGIIGAGDVGANLARELLSKRHLGLEPVAFFDDDRHSWRSRVHGIPVLGSPELLLETQNPPARQERSLVASLVWLFHRRKHFHLNEVIIAMPSAPAKRIAEVVQILQKAGYPFRTIPSMDQLATGAVKVTQLRPVEIQDLLGRDPVRVETENIRAVLEGKVVMVTGAGGSIGSELCRQIVNFDPERLLLVEQSEAHMFQIEQDLISRGFGGVIQPCIGNVLDRERMLCVFERFMPSIVFHAAAHKHVPMMESHPGEAIKNNTLGTACMAQLSIEYDVERFVLISTDKAINPTNVMGASKRLAEMYLQALHGVTPCSTRLMGVRFGNVLGSSGSVIPTFARQIAAGGPVKVTHPEITRYFMTIPEAVSLVLQSCAQGQGGEIFVLDMGKPVRIVDLAKQMIILSGLKPGEDIEIEFIGLRPGEKLFEELSHEGENIAPTLHPKIMRFIGPLPDLDELKSILDRLTEHLHTDSPNQLKLQLKRIIPEYHPHLVGTANGLDSALGASVMPFEAMRG